MTQFGGKSEFFRKKRVPNNPFLTKGKIVVFSPNFVMEEPILGEDTLPVAPKDDEVLALAILVIAAVVVVIVGISMWRRNSSNSVSSDRSELYIV